MPSASSNEGPSCQVSGCRASLVKDGHYFVRRRICRKHCTADEICVGEDEVARYCQQCSRIQPTDDFDAGRRSCRASLAAHNRRRLTKGRGAAAASEADGSPDSSSGAEQAAGQPSGTTAAAAQQSLTRQGVCAVLPTRAYAAQEVSGQPQPGQAQRSQLKPGRVAAAMLAAIGRDMAGSPAGRSSAMQQQQHARAGASPSSAAGGVPVEHAQLSGSKRGREPPNDEAAAAWLLGALEQQQEQLEFLHAQQQQQHQQQQGSMQPPSLLRQPTASDSLSSLLLADMAAADLATAQSQEFEIYGQPQPPLLRRSSSSSSSGKDPAVQQLVSVLRGMQPSAMPLLQLAIKRSRQQAGLRQQSSMHRPLMQPPLLHPSLSSPSLLGQGSGELSPMAQLTAAEQQPQLQHLTALLKNMPPGGDPLLMAALQRAELARQGGVELTGGSSPHLQQAPAAEQQQQGGLALPMQQQQQLAAGADQGLGPLLQQWLTAQGVQETSNDARAASPRTHARHTLPPLSLDAAPSPVQAGRNLQSLLLGAHAARAEGGAPCLSQQRQEG